MSKKIPLSNSAEKTIVDDEDYEWARLYVWRLHSDGHVVRDDNGKVIYLCNEVMCRANGDSLDSYAPPKPNASGIKLYKKENNRL